MYGVQFNIESDGDFYCEPLFTTVIHEDSNVLDEKLIANLRNIYETFQTTKDYVMPVRECIGRFLVAYDDDSITEYYDAEQEDVWFQKTNGELLYGFDLETGNHSITIREIELRISKIDGGYEILQTL